MAASSLEQFDRLKVTDERIGELLRSFVATVVVLTAIAWILKAGWTATTAVAAGYVLGGILALAFSYLLFRPHWVGFVGALVYLAVRMADIAATSYRVTDVVDVLGLWLVYAVLAGLLVLCRDDFLKNIVDGR